jgi:tRNA threonylcarbamoyladenosine biosynthesis protein TsaB
MWTLAAETSTPAGSVALFKDQTLIEEIKWEKENSHSERITLEAEKILMRAKIDYSQIDRYAVGTGPGSFTGIRVALNFIRTLAFTFDKPVIAADSLLLLAAPALAEGLEVFCMQAAFRNFIYCSHYSPDSPARTLLEPSALTTDEVVSKITRPVLALGRGYSLFEEVFAPDLKKNLDRRQRFSDVPSASHFGFLGLLDQHPTPTLAQQLRWNATKPLYIRASEAEEKLRQSVRK